MTHPYRLSAAAYRLLTKHVNRYKLRQRNMLRALGATWRANDSLRCPPDIAPDRGQSMESWE
jgi:hypothetical protein